MPTTTARTDFDRTNYYEQLPSNALPLALWLDADRMGNLLPVMDQAKLDLQRDVVKNERRQRYDNVPYGRANETILAALFPAGHPYHWPTIGSMVDLIGRVARRREEVLPHLLRAEQRDARHRRRLPARFRRGLGAPLLRRDPARPRRLRTPPALPAVTVQRDTFLVLEDKVTLPRLY